MNSLVEYIKDRIHQKYKNYENEIYELKNNEKYLSAYLQCGDIQRDLIDLRKNIYDLWYVLDYSEMNEIEEYIKYLILNLDTIKEQCEKEGDF